MQRASKLVLACLASIVMVCVVVEGLLRFEWVQLPAVYESYQFAEHPAGFRDQHMAFGFTPSRSYREAVVHARANDVLVEYDITFHVNNAGLVQERDIRRETAYTVVVGDSFTQGTGAPPWFYDLEAGFSNLPLANLGIGGTGVTHWAHALRWFEQTQAPVRNAVVLYITDDFLRPYWEARASDDGLSLCYEKECRLVASPYRPGSPEFLIEDGRQRLGRTSSVIDAMKQRARALLSQFRTGELAINARRWYFRYRPGDSPFLTTNKTSWSELSAGYNVLFALHLPQKEEAGSGQWTPLSREIKAYVEGTGVRTIDGLSTCGLQADDYFARDIHPNAKGYGKIRACLESLLRKYADHDYTVRSS